MDELAGEAEEVTGLGEDGDVIHLELQDASEDGVRSHGDEHRLAAPLALVVTY